ncbi:hypothetical protein N431DRAFT_434405 [Stipitochalara longipes BDJ]|nr:hypothetical protein N431DRAFT_434405 [Stipitochalara longipes BDJ]
MDLAYSGFMSAGDAKAFREAMADASTLCWTFSSILIGRITDMDEQYHPRQRQTITEDVEAARDEAPGQVTRGLLNERQRNDERSPVRGSKTWGDTFKSTFSLSSLLPSITSRVTSTFWSFLGRGTTKTDNSTNDTELNVFPSRSGQAGTDSIQTGGQGSEDRQEDSLHVVGDDSDEESERGSGSYSGHQIWRDPS